MCHFNLCTYFYKMWGGVVKALDYNHEGHRFQSCLISHWKATSSSPSRKIGTWSIEWRQSDVMLATSLPWVLLAMKLICLNHISPMSHWLRGDLDVFLQILEEIVKIRWKKTNKPSFKKSFIKRMVGIPVPYCLPILHLGLTGVRESSLTLSTLTSYHCSHEPLFNHLCISLSVTYVKNPFASSL